MTPAASSARKTVTIVFCDVTGSTALGEQLDPESLREVIQQYFARMRTVVERHGGTVEKFIGDAVMAVFGVPNVHEDDALRAVRAAADMQGALAAANDDFDRDFGVRIQARIGVNTGEVIAGDASSEQSFVSGDAVNTAARLEQAAEPGEVLLGEATYRLVRAAVIAQELPPLSVKGKAQPLPAYRLVVVEAAGQMLPRRFDAPLVGRDAELRTLLDAFDGVVSAKTCRIVTVVGDAGLGKSRLAHELATRIGGTARVLRGRCLPYGEGITFFPLTEVLQDAAGIAADDPPGVAQGKIAALLPDTEHGLAQRLAGILGAETTSGKIQETFFAVRRFLETVAESSPVVVVFDDIQWAEQTFLDLLQYLGGFVTGRPLLIVCLARPQLLEERADWTQIGETIRLQPIDASNSAELVANLLGDAESSSNIAATIVASAGGNPLFVEEMLRMLVDDGVLLREGSGWVVRGDVQNVAAPETVQAVIAARLDRLPAEEQKVLGYAAVVGEVFWWGAISALLEEMSSPEVGRRLQALVRRDLVRPDPSTFFSEDAFRFGHLLIRDVAYETLPKKTRADLHERFAGWVSEQSGERSNEYDEIVGFHLERAHRYLLEVAPREDRIARLARNAAERLARAGSRSADRGDMSAAANLLGRAVDLTPEDDARRPALLLDYAEFLMFGSRWTEAETVLARTQEEARRAGAVTIESRASLRAVWLGMHVNWSVEHKEARRIGEQTLETFEAAGDDEGLALALSFIGDVLFWEGACSASIDRYRRALHHAERARARRLASEVLSSIFLTLTQGHTHRDEVIAEIQASLDVYSDVPLRLKSQRYLGLMYAIGGDFERARAHAHEGIRMTREMGMNVDLAGGDLRDAAEVARLEGDIETAEAMLREAVQILERIGDRGHLDSVAPDLAFVMLLGPGREHEALEIASLADSALAGDVDAVVRRDAAKAIAFARLGRIEEAESLAREIADRAWRTEYAFLRTLSLEALSQVLRMAGRDQEAADALRRAITAHESKGNVASAERDRRELSSLQAAADRD